MSEQEKQHLKNRLSLSLVTGAALGVICIMGGSARAGGFSGNELYLAGMWYNRVIMGLVIGLAADVKFVEGAANRYVRGGLLGSAVSAAFFLSTEMRDVPAFFAGIVYGFIIEFVVRHYE